jgi:hypothetical protein
MGRLKILLVSAAILGLTDAAAAQQPRPQTPAGQQQRPAQSQQAPAPQQAQQPAPPRSYQPLPVKLPAPNNDPSFEAFRKQLAAVAEKKDRAGLGKLVVAKGFFWEGENGDKVDKRKSSLDNLAAAMGLDGKDGSGWEGLAAAANDPTLEPVEDRKGVMCGPASPEFDEQALEALTKATGTESEEWGFTTADGLEVRAAPQPNAPIIEKLGLQLIRVLPDDSQDASQVTMVRVVGPSGKVGYLPADALSPLSFDQICYIKDASGWKIAGYAGGDSEQ